MGSVFKSWCVVVLMCFVVSACGKSTPGSAFTTAETQTPILIFGDSLSAGYRVSETERWSTLLEQRLRQENAIRANQSIANESISGETTSGGLKRLPDALADHNPVVVVLELGANDGLRRQSLGAMKNNLSKMIALAQQHGARVILVGVEPPGLLAFVGTRSFTDVYEQLADEHDVLYVPDLFAKLSNSHMQDDRLHPNASGQSLMADVIHTALIKESNQ